jgi:hypothetical protein
MDIDRLIAAKSNEAMNVYTTAPPKQWRRVRVRVRGQLM